MRNVCGWTPASSAATEITYSARTSDSIGRPPVVRRGEQRRARVFVERIREVLDRLALRARQIDRYLHVDGDEQVAALRLAVARDSLAAHAQHLAARCPGRDSDRDRPIERRHLH